MIVPPRGRMPAHLARGQRLEVVLDEPTPAVGDPDDRVPAREAPPRDGPDDRVQAGAVAPAGEHADALHRTGVYCRDRLQPVRALCMRRVGIEPTRPEGQRLLRPPRLPVPTPPLASNCRRPVRVFGVYHVRGGSLASHLGDPCVACSRRAAPGRLRRKRVRRAEREGWLCRIRLPAALAGRLAEAREPDPRSGVLPVVDALAARRPDRRHVFNGRFVDADRSLPRQLRLGRAERGRRLGEVHVNFRGYPGATAIPSARTRSRRTGRRCTTKIPCFDDQRGHAGSAPTTVTVYTANQGVDLWHVLYAWRRPGTLYARQRARRSAVHVPAGRRQPRPDDARARARVAPAVGRGAHPAAAPRRSCGRRRLAGSGHLRARRQVRAGAAAHAGGRRSRRSSTSSTASAWWWTTRSRCSCPPLHHEVVTAKLAVERARPTSVTRAPSSRTRSPRLDDAVRADPGRARGHRRLGAPVLPPLRPRRPRLGTSRSTVRATRGARRRRCSVARGRDPLPERPGRRRSSRTTTSPSCCGATRSTTSPTARRRSSTSSAASSG